jgi:Flp pilus assembly protein TadD
LDKKTQDIPLGGFMGTSNFDEYLSAYRAALAALKGTKELDRAAVLTALTARDAVARALAKSRFTPPMGRLEIVKLDGELKKLAGSIASRRDIRLADWRASLRPPSKSWWWSLESLAPPDPADRFDWLWSALTAFCVIVSLSLMAEILKRFLSGGNFGGAFATLSPVILALLTGSGVLTKAGFKVGERFVAKLAERLPSILKVPRRFRQEWMLIMALVLLASTVMLWFSLPSIARLYNNSGYQHHQAGRLTSALNHLKRAVSLSPDSVYAHYNLGLVYEDLLDVKSAQAEYQIAMLGGLDMAYNNLARLYILQGKPTEAVSLLLSGQEKAQDASVRYAMLKNLGWARLVQERYDEAEVALREAVSLEPASAAAHCLLAQVFEGREDTERAAGEWENCLKYASSRASAEEDEWIGRARQFLVTPTPGGQP